MLVGSLLATLRIALNDPDKVRRPVQHPTNDRHNDRVEAARLVLRAPVPEKRGRGRLASGVGLVALIMILGTLLALGIVAAVVVATVALRDTVS